MAESHTQFLPSSDIGPTIRLSYLTPEGGSGAQITFCLVLLEHRLNVISIPEFNCMVLSHRARSADRALNLNKLRWSSRILCALADRLPRYTLLSEADNGLKVV